MTNYTPSNKPLRIGDLVILIDEPRGYCAEITEAHANSTFQVRLLDSTTPLVGEFLSDGLIQTGKTPHDLIRQYIPSPQEFSDALSIERSLPDFTKLKKKGGKKKKEKDLKELSPEQKKFLGRLIAKKILELKETKK